MLATHGVPAPSEVMEPGDPRDHVDRDRREQQREHDPERLARHRPAEGAQPRAVAAMPPGGLPHVGEHDDREQREGARPFHRRGGAERGPGGEAPRPPDRRDRGRGRRRGDVRFDRSVGVERREVGWRVGIVGLDDRRAVLGHGLSSVDPAPVEQEQHEGQDDPELEVDVEQADARHHHVQVLDRHQQAGDRGPQCRAEQQLRQDRCERDDEGAGDHRGDPPAEGPHPEGLDPHRDLPFAQRGVHPRADVPFLLAPVLLVARVDRAGVVRPSDEDARRLRVIHLVEDVVRRVADVHDPKPAGEEGDRSDRHDRTVESRQRTHDLSVPVAFGSTGLPCGAARACGGSIGRSSAGRTAAPGTPR